MNDTNTNHTNCLVIANVEIATDNNGLFNLNALHKAGGLSEHKKPSQWLRLKSTQELINSLKNKQSVDSHSGQKAINVNNGGTNQGTFAHELLAISYAGWIKPSFQLLVNQAFIDYRAGKLISSAVTPKNNDTGLPEFRKARAVSTMYGVAEKLCSHLPSLSEQSKQAIYAGLINPIAGPVIPLPILEELTYSASEVGKQLGISAAKVGTIANKHGLKTKENGITVLDQAVHSSKQVPTFRYNQNGINAIKKNMEASHG